jgi:hypothetical protein
MSLFPRFRNYFQRAERWYLTTPDRALEDAYDAALAVRAMEEQHFQGQKVGSPVGGYNANTKAYFDAELKKHLKTIRLRVAEFRGSRATIDATNPNVSLYKSLDLAAGYSQDEGRFVPPDADRISVILEKLKFIDDVLLVYEPPNKPQKAALVAQDFGPRNVDTTVPNSRDRSVAAPGIPLINNNSAPAKRIGIVQQTQIAMNNPGKKGNDLESITDKTGVLPRSILSTLSRLRRNLDPQSAAEAAELQRLNYAKTFVSVRFVLILVSLTLLAQLGTRYLLLSNKFPPGHNITEQYRVAHSGRVFINSEMEEKALHELARFEESLKFRNMLSEASGSGMETLSAEEMEERVHHKAQTLANSFGNSSADAVKNWVADGAGLIVFCLVLANSRREVDILKSFIDELVYGLSDSAKAFIIILLTDIFVGFHSSHGWEILLEGMADHFGVAPNRNFIFLFIATFPVILDTIFKYWIFRYLNRVSPSAVATYKEMNE